MAIFKNEATVSAMEIGDLLGLSTKTISALATSRVLVRSGRGRYDLKQSVRNYVEHLRKAASGRGSPVATENQRLVKERADAMAFKNATDRAEYVLASEVESTWSGAIRTIRAGMLAVPSRVSTRLPHLTIQDINELDLEIRSVLTDLGDGTAS